MSSRWCSKTQSYYIASIPVLHSDIGRPFEDREVSLRNVFRFRGFENHGPISDGKVCISYTDCKIRYDQSLLQNVCLNALETGLANETIRDRMRPIFQSSGLTDEELIREMNKAVTV